MPASFELNLSPPWLTARFAAPQRMLSWSVNRPGFQGSLTVAWLQVTDADLAPDVAAADYLAARLSAAGLERAVGLMTSRSLERFERSTATVEETRADCVITLGMSNAERVGSRSHAAVEAPTAGTVNLLCRVSEPLSDPAMIEAMSVATQARTTAILEHGYRPEPERGAVTGTGTDCIVLACPSEGKRSAFAGLHTAAGKAIGSAVLQATDRAMSGWLRENGLSPSP